MTVTSTASCSDGDGSGCSVTGTDYYIYCVPPDTNVARVKISGTWTKTCVVDADSGGCTNRIDGPEGGYQMSDDFVESGSSGSFEIEMGGKPWPDDYKGLTTFETDLTDNDFFVRMRVEAQAGATNGSTDASVSVTWEIVEFETLDGIIYTKP